MKKEKKTRGQLISELAKLRQRIAELEKAKVELERAEEQLRQTKEVFARAEQIGRFGHWYRDFAENKATWSEGTYRIFSGDPEQLDISYEAFLALVHPSDRGLLKSGVEAALAEGEGLDIEYRIIRPDGTVRNILSFAEVRFDKSGKPVGLDGTVHDITKRKHAEEALHSAHTRLQATFDAIQENMNIVDLDFYLTDVNEVLIKNFGLSNRESVLGRKCFEVLKGRKDICPNCAVAEAYQSKAPVYRTNTPEDEVRTPGRSFEIFAYPIMDENGNISGAVEFARDITSRKQAENELRESEERFRAVLEAVPDLMIVSDAEGRYREIFTANSDLLYAPADQLLDKTVHDVLPPEDAQQMQEVIDRVLATGKLQLYEHGLKTGGIDRWFAGRATKFSFQNADCVLWCARDITARKKAEDALRKSEAELTAQSRHLEEVNAALKVLLRQRENDKADLEQRLHANVKELVMPYIEKLKNSRSHSDRMTLFGILESNMKEIVSPLANKLSSRFLNLTPTEIQVASLIKDGKTSKEIAALLNASEHTIRSHRFHIRSKLGIKNKKVNMRSYLKSLHHE